MVVCGGDGGSPTAQQLTLHESRWIQIGLIAWLKRAAGCSVSTVRKPHQIRRIPVYKGIAPWLAHYVQDPEVYITVSISDLRRGVAQARALRSGGTGWWGLKQGLCLGLLPIATSRFGHPFLTSRYPFLPVPIPSLSQSIL
jgi:hypothetical protein